MFEGDSADTCAGKFLLTSMGGWAEGLACADPGARTPIGVSRILLWHRLDRYVSITLRMTSFCSKISKRINFYSLFSLAMDKTMACPTHTNSLLDDVSPSFVGLVKFNTQSTLKSWSVSQSCDTFHVSKPCTWKRDRVLAQVLAKRWPIESLYRKAVQVYSVYSLVQLFYLREAENNASLQVYLTWQGALTKR